LVHRDANFCCPPKMANSSTNTTPFLINQDAILYY
jgi:hypothetical protein